MNTKYIFVTGGVVSGLGKGITAASLGRLLKNRGYKVTIQKFDPYLNVDPGTMSPYEHGEVFVTDDGAETDLDLGHYERFINENLEKNSSITMGKIYSEVIEKERRGDYLRKKKFRKIEILATQILIVVAFIGIWELLARLGKIDSFITSQPSRIVKTFLNLSSNDLRRHPRMVQTL